MDPITANATGTGDTLNVNGTAPLSEGTDLHIQEILLVASSHDIKTLNTLIDAYSFPDCRAVDVQDPETGFTPLHAAIAACEDDDDDGDIAMAGVDDGVPDLRHELTTGRESRPTLLSGAKETVAFLLENGAIWNQLDRKDETPGCVAYRLGLEELYGVMVDAGVRAEMLLGRLEQYERLDDEDYEVDDEGSNHDKDHEVDGDEAMNGIQHQQKVDEMSAPFLSSTLSMESTRILDDQQNGVMMAWESNIMQRSADALLSPTGSRVLNIGFGMGIFDTFIQNHQHMPITHHIIEAHPAVLAKMRETGWYDRPNVTVHEGRWQDVLPRLVAEGHLFDAIFSDTFAESYSEFRHFFSEYVIGLLEQDGRWSYFNGMGADRQISYDVYQKVVEMDLFEAGFDVEWLQEIDVPDLGQEWNGVKRKYWNIKKYRVPLVRFMD